MNKEELYELSEGIRKCTACPLWESRTLVVPGEGLSKTKVMFVGEAPGAEEDRVGRPFVGRAGKFLDDLFEKNGIKRKDVFITGSVKCHPPKNRNPTAKELKTCKGLWLDKQIEIIKPELIVILGGIALKSLFNKTKINAFHGKTITKNKQEYFVTYHPAAGMRFLKIRKEMEKDFKKLGKLIRNI